MKMLLLFCGGFPLILAACARLVFLASSPVGWLFYLPNVCWEFAAKRVRLPRAFMEAAVAVLGLFLLWAGGMPLVLVMGCAVGLLGLETAVRIWERRLLTDAYVMPDHAAPAPSVNPDLVLMLEAPFQERVPELRLGTLWEGEVLDFEVRVGNHSRVPTQTPIRVHLTVLDGWLCGSPAETVLAPLRPGSVGVAKWRLRPGCNPRGGSFCVTVEWGDVRRERRVLHGPCLAVKGVRVIGAEVRRYPGGRLSAFAWRGDMDLYDEASFQSVEGLESALGLAAQYCFPQTLYLSTRLSLDESEARKWAGHYGVERGATRIQQFVRWLGENVELRHACAYPFIADKRFVMELGNHGHLHYDTATSATAENGWRQRARMGAGRYLWSSEDRSSFGEQRDNALEAQRWCKRMLGFEPRSWAKPGRCNDRETPRAMVAAGCRVLSGSDIRARDNVLRQPEPHHPGGTDAVELTTRYPCDPQHVYHVGMLLFWLYRSHRLARPMVYMCHQHLRQFDGHACMRFTEYLLRTVLTRFNGDFYVDTVFGIGSYWLDVLNPATRRVAVSHDGKTLTVRNGSDVDFCDLPIEITPSISAPFTVLASVKAGDSLTINLFGGQGAGAMAQESKETVCR